MWPGLTYFPDFHQPNTQRWWQENVELLYNEVKFDGLWIDMNEPSSFIDMDCPENHLNHPPWKPMSNQLYSKTICPSYFHGTIRHYNLHNLYGLDHAKATHLTLENMNNEVRPFLLSRSTSLTSGNWTAHWTGDNWSIWEDIHISISQMFGLNLFGVTMVGADVCGFTGRGMMTHQMTRTVWENPRPGNGDLFVRSNHFDDCCV